MNNEIDIKDLIPSSDEGKLEFFKELNRNKEAIVATEASIKIEEEKTTQKKCELGISWGDAVKAFAPIVMAIIASGVASCNNSKDNNKVDQI